jgi:hypothetical protein
VEDVGVLGSGICHICSKMCRKVSGVNKSGRCQEYDGSLQDWIRRKVKELLRSLMIVPRTIGITNLY